MDGIREFLLPCLSLILINLGCVCESQNITCVYAVCRCSVDVAICKNLTSMPELVPGSETLGIRIIEFKTGSLPYIGDNSLPPNLTTIQLENNPISSISRGAFLGSGGTLQKLVIRKAAFTELPDALLQLHNLTSLALYDMPLNDWHSYVLQNLYNTLTCLSLDNINIHVWPDWLQSFSLLQAISVSNGAILSMHDNAFSSIQNTLHYLNLTNTSLTAIPYALKSLRSLHSLNLSLNNISDVIGLPASSSLDLSYNNIQAVDMLTIALRQSTSRLVSLRMEYNDLKVIPDLSELLKLQILVLSYNQIADPNKGLLPSSLLHLELKSNQLPNVPLVVATLTNLKYLDLSSNKITDISPGSIPPELVELHLEDNKLVEIMRDTFPADSSLHILNLKSNPIFHIDSTAFAPIKNVTDLNLSKTKLITVPSSLVYLVSLTMLDIADVPSLSCACQLDNQLMQWFSAGNLIEVKGTCNQGINVRDFFNRSNSDGSTCAASLFPPSLSFVVVCLMAVQILFFNLY